MHAASYPRVREFDDFLNFCFRDALNRSQNRRVFCVSVESGPPCWKNGGHVVGFMPAAMAVGPMSWAFCPYVMSWCGFIRASNLPTSRCPARVYPPNSIISPKTAMPGRLERTDAQHGESRFHGGGIRCVPCVIDQCATVDTPDFLEAHSGKISPWRGLPGSGES